VPQAPCEVVVVCNEAHVVGVDRTEGSEPISNDGEQGNEDIIDHIDDI